MLAIPPLADAAATNAATYLAVSLHTLAREERAARRPRRLVLRALVRAIDLALGTASADVASEAVS